MKVQILGTAAATAMPLPFCNCRVCKESRKRGGKSFRKRSAALINDELLIDLSPDLCSMAYIHHIDLGKIRYLLQTHSHSDHFDAGHFVTRSSSYATQSLIHLDIICSRGTCDDMNHWIKENESDMDIYDLHWQKDMNFDLHLIRAGETLCIGPYSITALDSMHDERVEALIYLIEYEGKNILYGTDLKTINMKTWEILKNRKLDLVILDQTYGEGFNAGGHLDAGQVVSIIGKIRELAIINERTQIYATHISHEGNDVHETMEQLANKNGYHIAYDGCTFLL